VYFVVPLVLGYHRQAVTRWLSRIPRVPLLLATSSVFGLMLYLHLTGGASLPAFFQRDDVREQLDAWFQKGNAGPLRLVSALFVFQFAFLFVTYFWTPNRPVLGCLLGPLGQSSLYAYAAQSS